MHGHSLIRLGDDRLRIVSWRQDTSTALVAPLPDAPTPGPDAVRQCVAVLGRRGVVEVVTGALAPREQAGFLAAGFQVRERLHLLAHDLGPLAPPPAGVRSRRARRADRVGALCLDQLCFDDFWQLDEISLEEALTATASSRFRVVGDDAPVGYAITGRSGRHGYLQRLAVHPAHRGRGVATALVLDGLRWVRRHGVSRAVVNTQESNVAAVRLYEGLGFRRQPDGLAVLGRRTDAGEP